jgi:hypothetical protein
VAILPESARILGNEDIIFVRLADAGAFLEIIIAWSAERETGGSALVH